MKQLLRLSSKVMMGLGGVFIIGGLVGIGFTHASILREKITTPSDASIASAPVSGPFTLKAEADIIREHTLKTTDGKVFAEIPRQVPKLDDDGQSVMDEKGVVMMVSNPMRNTWVTATTLITALNLGLLAYALFGFLMLFGGILVWLGFLFRSLSKSDFSLENES